MSTDDILDAYDFPDDFALHRAEDMDRVRSADGTEFVALVNTHSGERALVHADVVDYDGPLEHPMTTGFLGFLAVLGALLTPIAAGYTVTAATNSAALTLIAIFAGVLGGFVLANQVLYRTTVGDWLFRFLEWNDHRTHITVRSNSE